MVTCPRHTHKMCSRVGASIARATGFGDEMIVNNLEEYETRAVALAISINYTFEPFSSSSISTTSTSSTSLSSVSASSSGTVYASASETAGFYRGHGRLMNLRRDLFINRDTMPLFDTVRWTRNMEKGYQEVWRRWVAGTEFEGSPDWEACDGPEKESGCIFVEDKGPTMRRHIDD